MHTVNFLVNLVEHHQVLAYSVIFLGLIFEGEIILLSTGVLAHLGALNFYFALFFVLCGGIAKTLIGYHIGRIIHKRWNETEIVQYLEHKVLDILPKFRQRPFWSIFASKFIMGANYIVTIFSGYVKVKYKTYLKAELLATFIWAPLLLSLGYYFSYAALRISRDIWRFLLIVLLFVVAFVLIERMLVFIYEVFQGINDQERNQ